MISSYQVLGVSRQATDADIKQAYLQRVKDNPPERDQQRFQQIQQAFEAIKDQDSRLRYDLFQWPEVDFDVLLDQAFKQTRAFGPLSADEFCQLLQAVPAEKVVEKVPASTS